MTTIDWASCEVLVKSLASKYVAAGLDIEDLQQEARLAVIESHDKYEPDCGVSLTTFIGRRIRDALRSHVGKNTDSVEVTRGWVAESIQGGPSENLRASSKEACEALRQHFGEEKFKKPRRVIDSERVTVSLDADSEDEMNLHEKIGVGPEQEVGVLIAEMSNKVTTRVARNGDELGEIFRLRNEGLTFEQIGEQIGKDGDAVRKAYSRAQKKLSKKAA